MQARKKAPENNNPDPMIRFLVGIFAINTL
jgi:hypothetical protein